VERNFYELVFKPKSAHETGKTVTKGTLHGYEKDSADWDWKDQPEANVDRHHPLRQIVKETNLKNIPPSVLNLFNSFIDYFADREIDKLKQRRRLAHRNTQLMQAILWIEGKITSIRNDSAN
jgi:hypothetical protein